MYLLFVVVYDDMLMISDEVGALTTYASGQMIRISRWSNKRGSTGETLMTASLELIIISQE